MNTNELAPFGCTKSGRVRKTALKPKIALYGHTNSGRIRVKPLKSQIHNVCEDCGIKFDNEGWLTLKFCECCDDQRRTDEEVRQMERIERIRAERWVDKLDSPNILPYKKCGFCNERSSCGNYTDDDQWLCEDCGDKMICGLCDCDLGGDSGNDIIHTSPRGYNYCESCEDEHTYITAFLADDLETMKKMTKDKIERGKLQRLDKECRLGRPSKCKCNGAMDIRGRCCPITSPSSFAECPVSYDTTYFCIGNDYEAYKTYCALS
jgi:hypothetical protein